MSELKYKYEIGDTEPSLYLLVDIAMALDVSTDYLLDLTDTPTNPTAPI